MPIYTISKFSGGISSHEDKGQQGSFKFGTNLDIRKQVDSLSCNQTLVDVGVTLQSPSASVSPSASQSPSASLSPSPSLSVSPSASASPSPSGVSPSSSKSPSSSQSSSASVSPSASASPSYSVSPSVSPSAGLKTVFSDLIIKFVKASDGFLYGFGNTGKIYRRDSDGYWKQVYNAGTEIKGAEEKPSSGGKTYLMWATNTELHRKELPGRSDWNDVDTAGSVQGDTWPKTNLTSSDYHTMTQVAGDVMIANKNTLAMAAYDDSYTNEALDLIPGNIAKTVIERNGRAVVGTYRTGDPNNGINAAIDAEVPLVQVGDDGQLVYADFTSSVPARRFPGGGKVNPSGVANKVDQVMLFDWDTTALSWINKQVIGNLALFAVYGATSGYNGIYSYGRLDKDKPFVLNLDFNLEVDELGALTVLDGKEIVSYRSGTSFGVKERSDTLKATATYEGLDFYAPVKNVEKATGWNLVEVFMKPLPVSCSLEFWYRTDKNGAFVRAYTADGQTSYSTTSGTRATFRIGAIGDIYEPRIVLNPYLNTTPEVYRFKTFFA